MVGEKRLAARIDKGAEVECVGQPKCPSKQLIKPDSIGKNMNSSAV